MTAPPRCTVCQVPLAGPDLEERAEVCHRCRWRSELRAMADAEPEHLAWAS